MAYCSLTEFSDFYVGHCVALKMLKEQNEKFLNRKELIRLVQDELDKLVLVIRNSVQQGDIKEEVFQIISENDDDEMQFRGLMMIQMYVDELANLN